MSVTFSIEWLNTGEYEFSCFATENYREETFGPYESYDAALLAIAEHKLSCAECDIYGCYANPIADVNEDLNLSNTNATMMLDILGIDYDPAFGLCGHMSGEDFLGHVLVALAQERDNSAVKATVDSTPGSATFIDCGLEAGYVETRLVILADMATEAKRLGRDITWG